MHWSTPEKQKMHGALDHTRCAHLVLHLSDVLADLACVLVELVLEQTLDPGFQLGLSAPHCDA